MENSTKPKVSIVINCFNGARYLKEALASVVSQTFDDWDIIFWDNQSTDGSRDIFSSYSDPRFHYFYADAHLPLGDARNLAVAKATGEWVAFLDCDDYWLPDKLERQMKIVHETGGETLGLVYGRAVMVLQRSAGNLESIGEIPLSYAGRQLPEGNIFHDLLMENFIPLVSSLVRKKAYLQCNGIPVGYKQAEDYALFLRIAKDWNVAALQDKCCFYRIHDSNASLAQKRLALEESLRAVLDVVAEDDRDRVSRRHSTALSLFLIWEGEWVQGGKMLIQRGAIVDVLMIMKQLLINRYSLLIRA